MKLPNRIHWSYTFMIFSQENSEVPNCKIWNLLYIPLCLRRLLSAWQVTRGWRVWGRRVKSDCEGGVTCWPVAQKRGTRDTEDSRRRQHIHVWVALTKRNFEYVVMNEIVRHYSRNINMLIIIHTFLSTGKWKCGMCGLWWCSCFISCRLNSQQVNLSR